jgi:hypothetical protein
LRNEQTSDEKINAADGKSKRVLAARKLVLFVVAENALRRIEIMSFGKSLKNFTRLTVTQKSFQNFF